MQQFQCRRPFVRRSANDTSSGRCGVTVPHCSVSVKYIGVTSALCAIICYAAIVSTRVHHIDSIAASHWPLDAADCENCVLVLIQVLSSRIPRLTYTESRINNQHVSTAHYQYHRRSARRTAAQRRRYGKQRRYSSRITIRRCCRCIIC